MMSNNSHNLFFREIYNLSSLLETSPDLFGESSVLRVSHEANRTVYVRDNSVRYVTDSKDAGAELENWSHSDIIKASPIGIVIRANLSY